MLAVSAQPRAIPIFQGSSSFGGHRQASATNGHGLQAVLEQVASQLGADAMQVSLHEAGEDRPKLLFTSGAWLEAEALVTEIANSAVNDDDPYLTSNCSPIRWTDLQSGSRGGSLLDYELPGPDTSVVSIRVIFTAAGRAVRTTVEAVIAGIQPVLGALLRLTRAQDSLQYQIADLRSALNRSDVGVLLLDCDGRLIFANDSANELLDGSSGLRRHGKTFVATNLSDAVRLRSAVDHVTSFAASGSSASMSAPVVALRRDANRRPLLLSIFPPHGESSEGRNAAAIIYIFNPDRDSRPLLGPACRLYGLSPVEARLTCQLVAGSSLSEAAVEIGVKEQTARGYLKQIFSKTQTNRQAELVSVMLSSAVRIAKGIEVEIV